MANKESNVEVKDGKVNGTEDTLIADKALGAAPVKKAAPSKYKAGLYRSDKFLRIIKELTYTHQRDELGRVQKTYGTWSNEKNMIIFSKGVERRLSEDEIALPSIQRLIDQKTIYRVGD